MTFRSITGLGRPAALLTVPALLALLSFSACNDEKEGTTVTFGALHHGTPDALGNFPDLNDAGHRMFLNDTGYWVTLTRGYFVISAVEIRPSLSPAGASPLLGFLNVLLPAAYAHSEASPTRLGAPNVIDLLADDASARELGHIEPPPGAYAKLRISWGPADDDAGFLPSDFDMENQTLRLEGRAVEGADTLNFIVTDAGTDSLDVIFAEDSEHAAPGWLGVGNDRLTLAAGEEATIGIGMTYDTWFNGVDFHAMSASAIHDKVLANIRQSIGFHALTGDGHHHAASKWPTGS